MVRLAYKRKNIDEKNPSKLAYISNVILTGATTYNTKEKLITALAKGVIKVSP